ESNWSWNYGKTLPAMGYDVCLVALPDRARADIQVSAEYVVYAIRQMARRSGHKVDVVGFSQGPLEPRWAIKYWPDVRASVGRLVAMSGVGHGFTETNYICSSECIAPFWQMKPDSQFLVGPVAVVVVVAEDGDDGDADAVQLVGQRPGLVRRSDPGEVPGQEQHVGPLGKVLEVGPQGPRGVRAEVDVPHGGDVDHRSAPSSSAVAGGSGRWSIVVVALSIS